MKKAVTLLFPPLLIALAIVGVLLLRTPSPTRVASLAPTVAPTITPAPSATPAAEPSPEPSPGPDRYETALERYLAKRDKVYSWEKVHEFERPRYKGYVLKMISQQWRNATEVSLSVWEHLIVVMIPKELDPNDDRAMLFVTGMSNMPMPLPEEGSYMGALISVNAKCIVAELRMVPNQPIEFDNDFADRFEDDLVAKSWMKFMETGEETWPVQVPMTKAVVRGMDAVQDFLANHTPGRHPVDKFTLCGGGNRAWAVWLAAAFDTRVFGIAPMVNDGIDFAAALDHQFASWGEWSTWMGDYKSHGVFERRGTPEFGDLMTVISPHNYIDRIIVPKFIVSASGDETLPPDPAGDWRSKLVGETYYRTLPNASHSLGRTDTLSSLISWQGSMVRDKRRPVFEEVEKEDGWVEIYCSDLPHAVSLWKATNEEARDFRAETEGVRFESEVLEPLTPGVYVIHPDPPEKGWLAWYVELIFVSGERYPHTFTTRVRIMPDVYPGGAADQGGAAE